MENTAAQIYQSESLVRAEHEIASLLNVFELQNYDELRAAEKRYLPLGDGAIAPDILELQNIDGPAVINLQDFDTRLIVEIYPALAIRSIIYDKSRRLPGAMFRTRLWFFTGTPCSYLKPFINYVIDHEAFNFVGATNEGDAIAMASGAVLAGGKSVVMFQNSGLGNAVNPLTSLAHTLQIPLLLIITLRGEPGGPPDEPQHQLMGPITLSMLDVMRIKWEYFPKPAQRDRCRPQQGGFVYGSGRPPLCICHEKK